MSCIARIAWPRWQCSAGHSVWIVDSCLRIAALQHPDTLLACCTRDAPQLQALPGSMREPGEAALLEAARKHQWRNCPKCGRVRPLLV